MNSNRKSGTLIRLTSSWISLGLAGLLFAANPTVSSAAGGPEGGRGSSITGTALAENGAGLREVVITLEPLTRLKGASHVTQRAEIVGATLINRGGHFYPNLLVVSPGTKVSFKSGDGLFHTAELSSAGRLLSHLALLADGPNFAYTFTAPGIIAIKDWMNPGRDPAYIVIPETRYFDVSNNQGQFAIRDIPAGAYTLRAWQKDQGSRAFVVTVEDAAETEIAFVLDAPKVAELSPTHLPVSTSADGE